MVRDPRHRAVEKTQVPASRRVDAQALIDTEVDDVAELILDLDMGPDSSGQVLSRLTGWPLAPLEWRTFEDGEFKLRPLVDVRGQHVVVIARTAHDVHNRIIALAILLAALRRQEAQHVSVVMPSLPYARKDRVTQIRDPLSLQWLARLLESSGMNALWTFESHNPAATDNAFRCAVHALELHEWLGMVSSGHPGLAHMLRAIDAVIAPDAGGVRRALALREALSQASDQPIGFAMMDKRRTAGVVGGDPTVVGEIAGLRVLLVDDLISSGNTLSRATAAMVRAGALEVHALIAHGRPGQEVLQRLGDAGLRSLTLSDSQAQEGPRLDPAAWGIQGTETQTGKTGGTGNQGMTFSILPVMPLFAQRMLRTLRRP